MKPMVHYLQNLMGVVVDFPSVRSSHPPLYIVQSSLFRRAEVVPTERVNAKIVSLNKSLELSQYFGISKLQILTLYP